MSTIQRSSHQGLTFFLASLPGGTRITVEFVDQLLEHYREQKLLHRRYAFQILLDARNYFMSQPSLVNITVIQTQILQLKASSLCDQNSDLIFEGKYDDIMQRPLQCNNLSRILNEKAADLQTFKNLPRNVSIILIGILLSFWAKLLGFS